MVVREQPRCRCQKQPCTNIASRAFLKTMSGLPGRSRLLVAKRSPSLRKAWRSKRSGPVPRRPTAFMMRERSGVVAGGRLGSRAMIGLLAGSSTSGLATCCQPTEAISVDTPTLQAAVGAGSEPAPTRARRGLFPIESAAPRRDEPRRDRTRRPIPLQTPIH